MGIGDGSFTLISVHPTRRAENDASYCSILKYIKIYLLHALSLAGLGVHESSLREPMDATFWLKEMSQNSIHFVFNLVVLSRFWLTKG